MTLPYPWTVLDTLPQSFLVAADSRSSSYREKWTERRVDLACHAWLKDVFSDWCIPYRWEQLDGRDQVRVEAELREVCERVREGKVFSPDRLHASIHNSPAYTLNSLSHSSYASCAPLTLRKALIYSA
ncbi:hypothetical protein JCM8547_000405 [Rhodosporidiobolus lusitaniae]